jgi:hypothetical protein
VYALYIEIVQNFMNKCEPILRKVPPSGWPHEWPKHVGGITTFMIYFHKLVYVCWTGGWKGPSFLKGRGKSLFTPGIDTRFSSPSGRGSVFRGTKQRLDECDI